MKKIHQTVLEKETFEILIFILYMHVDNIVIYNLRVVGSNPSKKKTTKKHFNFLLYHCIIFYHKVLIMILTLL